MAPIESVGAGLRASLRLPVTVRWFGDTPRLFAAATPVTPVNLALRDRVTHGQSRASARSYAYSAGLFLSFLASLNRTLIEASNADFMTFTRALVGQTYLDANGLTVALPGLRSARTGQNTLARLYGLFGDIEAAYGVTFDWRRFRAPTYRGGRLLETRVHRFRVPTKAPLALPDEQFGRLIEHAAELWDHSIPSGDAAYAADPESQRGALFARNLAILMVLRYAGARRGEVAPIDLGDIDRARGFLYLVTKGRYGGREPVVLLPAVDAALMRYVLSFRPHGIRPFKRHARQRPRAVDRTALFLSHSAHGYGERISDQSVRVLIDRLRPALDPPWRENLHPHLLRHSFAHELERLVGPFAASANLRHRSLRSIDPYRGDVHQWADQLREVNELAAAQLAAVAMVDQ